ncbi:putative phage-associated protein [Flavobacterium sp. CG_9.1]|uniref:Uncharacterized phage-associated protein n=1 Tax=Flavobacterium xanthum TaxID=69322 RepID=A0A1M7H423_9FLAO|nr:MULTISPECIES: Panacea domain-containing protein [Flavobacterium]MBG6062419.1 putative phage-associated protein [Flavobacterium sp. CG_9.1]SHM23404.1 Uncharacterized phage-associated protein [Flavobacterium xanthum]
MINHNKYSRNQIDKLGNGLIYLIEKMGFLPKTSLLKLVYILDEFSVKKRGFPMFNLQYEIWKYGPVCQDLYIEFNDGTSLLKEYIKSEIIDNKTHISAVNSFNDDEFSDSDIAIFDEIVTTFSGKNTNYLVDYTHQKNSLWYTTAQKNGVLDALLKEEINATDFKIDFADLVSYDENKLAFYKDHLEFLNFTASLNQR